MHQMSDEEEYQTPEEILDAAKNVKNNLLPDKSRGKYEAAYNHFLAWKKNKKALSLSEDTLIAYFSQLSKELKPPTIWSRYSMIRSKLISLDEVDLKKYKSLQAFLKKNGQGYKGKKAQILTSENLQKFFVEAPNNEFLAIKIATIFGINGGLRSNELTTVSVKHVEIQGQIILVQIPKTKTGITRSFTIKDEFAEYVKTYMNLRPPKANPERFFLSIRNGKCTVQPIGINSFAAMPQRIAKFLNLPNPHLYTGHCFRRTSATLLVDGGADLTVLKRHGGWKSNSVAEGYIEHSLRSKIDIADRITSHIHLPSTSISSDKVVNAPKRQKMSNEIDAIDSTSEPTTKFEDLSNETIQIPNKISVQMTNCTSCTVKFDT